MPTPFDLPADDVLDRTAPFTPGARLGWWGGYVGLVFLAFCFGVWTGNQRPKAADHAAAPTPGEKIETRAPDPTPDPPAKKELTPEPKRVPEVKPPEAKKTPEVKAPEPKKAVEPPPEPKKVPEVKKTPEPKTPAVKEVLFVKDVQPIFKAKCTLCHGDTKNPKGDLDLRSLAAALKGGDNGPGVKGSDLKGGTVWASIDDGSMPPAGKEPLTEAEKTVVRNWILSGAK